MSDEANAGDETYLTFNVKSSSDAKFAITMPASATVLELKNKLATKEYADLPADRQRLIYSGRVLKDPDTLGSHKIKDGNTVHLVRSASSNQRQNPANQGGAAGANSAGAAGTAAGSGAAAVPSNIAAGTGNNVLAGLTGARFAGLAQLPGAGMFGPDGGMGAPPGPEQMANMLSNPQFASAINEALQNPAVLDMMIQQNPMLRNVPGARQMMQSPEFRRMLTDPETIRSMSQMGRAMGMNPAGGLGGGGGGGGFPAPGVTDTTPPGAPGSTEGAEQTPNQANPAETAPNPFAMFGQPGAAGAAGNPFAALFGNPALMGAIPGATPPTGAAPGGNAPQEGQAPANPFAALFNVPGNDPTVDPQQNPVASNPRADIFGNPQAMQRMMQVLGPMLAAQQPGGAASAGGEAGAFNPFAMFGAGGSPAQPAAPPDTRPPEERYAEQLRQLNDMGFYEFERNIEALRRSGGSVQGAVEYLLTH